MAYVIEYNILIDNEVTMAQYIKGLSTEEVIKYKERYGTNELFKKTKSTFVSKIIEVFSEPMLLLLLCATVIYFIIGQFREGIVMLVFVSFVSAISFIQQWKTDKTMNELKNLVCAKVYVFRDGKKTLINSSELVPKDVIYISSGERIPADCEVVEASNFYVDEAVLTGEAEATYKLCKKDLTEDKDYWKRYMLYAGTLAVSGTCLAIVKTIGVDTEYGKIGKSIYEIKDEPTPLERKVGSLVKNLAKVGALLCFVVISLSYFTSGNILKSIMAGITLAMAIIPEEFPVVLTVFLSMGAYRLAKKNVIMRKISAVETLGATTVLCVDKTGTITENKMKIKEVYSKDLGSIGLERIDKNLALLSILASERDSSDSLEKAILDQYSNKFSLVELNALELCKKFDFDSKTKTMANIYIMDSEYYVAAKGSPEAILELTNLSAEEKLSIKLEFDKMASKGLRVLAFAEGNDNRILDSLDQYNLDFIGLIGFQDSPKAGVLAAVKGCNAAGIRVVMITGDYYKTAMAIGQEIGLKFSKRSITGDEIEKMDDYELREAVKECDVFSRVIPSHKMRIVKALKDNGEIVAMTGDGVNDAPALKDANIGIAMGKRGTEVAKEASDMIILDDSFTTIVDTVRDGRRIFTNIRKAMIYILIIHIPIVALALFSPMFNLPQILLPMHIMLLELIIDPTCSIIFELEPEEANVMKQPPRSPKEPLLTEKMVKMTLLLGTTLFLAAFLPFHYLVDNGFSVSYARSFSLVVLLIGNMILVLVSSSGSKPIIKELIQNKNKIRTIVNIVSMVTLLLVIYNSFLQTLFQTSPLELQTFTIAVIVGILSTGWWEVVKYFKK